MQSILTYQRAAYRVETWRDADLVFGQVLLLTRWGAMPLHEPPAPARADRVDELEALSRELLAPGIGALRTWRLVALAASRSSSQAAA